MTALWKKAAASALALAGGLSWAALAGGGSQAFGRGLRLDAGEREGWASRTVWACDRRKAVIVEGVRPDEKLPPARAQRVADLLTDLMRYCNLEITARIDVNEVITVEANGRVHQNYVPGGPLPIVQASFGEPTPREQQIWKAELERLVAEGDRLFHSDEIGSNGMACAMCHPQAANTHPETYPKFQVQLGRVALLRDMINWCIEHPVRGPKLDPDSEKMRALEAYILAQRKGATMNYGAR
jgi:thiosulfate dehydrogenase